MVGRIPYWYHYGKNPQEFDMGIQATLKVTQKSAWFTPVKIWLVVYLPLWKILVTWDDYSQYMEK